MEYLHDKIILDKWKETNDTQYVYALFTKNRSRLENQIKKTILYNGLNFTIKDFVNEMYTATLDACNAYRVRDSSGTFVRRLYKYNFFHVKRKLRVLLANNNAVLNSCFKNKEQLETSHDELIMEDKLQNTNFMSMEEKFLSFLHTRKYYNAKVKKAILLKYHGYKEEHITKITKISKTNLHSYLKYFQSNFRKKVLNNNYNSNNKNNRKFN